MAVQEAMTKFKLPKALVALLLWPLTVLAFGETPIEDLEILTLKTLTKESSPYLIDHDVLVRPEGELVIEPGVEVRFAPEVGITVRGVLKAQGTLEDKIKFVPLEQIEAKQPNRTIRLVDGPNINEGIVQLLELGRWQSVCTNSRNWTQADLEVACRQLGFQGGEWVFWYPHLNDTNQILYQDPGKKNTYFSKHHATKNFVKSILLSAKIKLVRHFKFCEKEKKYHGCMNSPL